MKVIAFNGSARKGGNTAEMLKAALAPIEKAGIETELVEMSGKKISGCLACMKCFKEKDMRCAADKDKFNDFFEKMVEADGILLGSPTYFANVSTEMKALIDRAGMVARANDNAFRRKVGAAVVAARRGGAIHTFNSINHLFFISEMAVAGSDYWNMAFGREKGEVLNDAEGMGTMAKLGENMAWMIQKLNA